MANYESAARAAASAAAASNEMQRSLLLRLVFGGAVSGAPSSEADVATVRKRLQLTVLSAVAVSSLVTAGGLLVWQRLLRSHRRHDLEDSARGKSRGAGRSRNEDSFIGKGKGRADARGNSDGTSTPRLDAADVLGDWHSLAGSTPDLLAGGSDSPAPRYLGALQASMPGPDAYRKPNARRGGKMAPKWDESLLREQLTRNYSFLGEEGMAKVRNSFVIVVGAGGVGSWAALMLLRSGVSHLRIIDFDQVSLSSLNRHACATLADVGRPKVVCLAEFLGKIAPWAKIEAWVDVFKAEDADRLLQGKPDWVVDAIDSIDPKIDLIRYCFEHDLRVIASMGAGGKADPSRVQISDITETFEDPLAASVRRRLRLVGIPPLPPKQQNYEPPKSKKQLRREKKAAEPRPSGSAEGGLKITGDLPRSSTSSTITNENFADALKQAKSPASPSPAAATGAAVPETPQRSLSRGPSTMRHSRRASSSSSLGSGVYSTPLSTPRLEPEQIELDTSGERLLEGVEEETASQKHAGHEAQSSDSVGDATVVVTDEPQAIQPGQSVVRRATDDLQEMEPESEADKLEITSDGGGGTPADASMLDPNGEPEAAMMIPCVYSTEKSDVRLLPLPEDEFQKGRVDELSPLEQMRVRILPVLGPMPAMFGLAAATYVICQIGEHRLEPLAHKRRRKIYDKIHSDLEHSEKRHPAARGPNGQAPPLLFSHSDVAYLFEDVFAGRTIVPPFEALAQAMLLRWDPSLPLSWDNVALFSREQGKVHEKQVLAQGKSPYAVWGEDATKRLRVCQARERYMREIREM